MMPASAIDWEDAFSNAAYIQGGEDFPAIWEARAAKFRATVRADLDIPYGTEPREAFDIFLPDGKPRGLAVFIHGGFWLGFGKSDWSDLAQGVLEHGWAMALPQYTLAPAARISAMTRQVAAAISAAAERVSGPIHLSGHSAGGHLASRMVCQDSPLPQDIQRRVHNVVSISGVHDLRPLRLHSMNQKLGLDENEASSESPVLLKPLPKTKLTAWVGARERPEFLRQSALLAEAWGRLGAETCLVCDPARHHFDVVEGLKSPDHPLTRTLLDI